jgi:WD40 repeat protein
MVERAFHVCYMTIHPAPTTKRRSKMLRSNKLNHVKYNASMILALVVFIGAALLITGPAAFTAPLSGPIWSAPVNLGPAFNSAFNDQQPAISPDGLSLYFTSNRPVGLGGFDMYVSHRKAVDEPWRSPVNLGPALNTTFDEGNAAFSRDGRLLFFQSKRLPTFGGIDIWVSKREYANDDFGWKTPVNLGAGVNSAFDDQGPYYFEDDVRGTRQLYFASGRPGLAGNDIYVSEQMADDSFGPAVLVTELSSLLNESDPSIRHDGLEIFLHSNRAGSIGTSLDLWVATRGSTLDAWSTPVNLGSTINTASAEQNAYLSSDGMTLFFASDRTGGSGLLDLYMSTRTLPTVRSKNISVAANDSCAANINPSDVDDGSFDPVNGGPLTLSLDPSGPFDLGPHTVRLIATDDRGVTNSALATVTVVDNMPPLITDASVDRPTLWPPNHRMVDVTVSYTASDNCGALTQRSASPAMSQSMAWATATRHLIGRW